MFGGPHRVLARQQDALLRKARQAHSRTSSEPKRHKNDEKIERIEETKETKETKEIKLKSEEFPLWLECYARNGEVPMHRVQV